VSLRHTIGVVLAGNLGKAFGGRWVFRHLEVAIEQGDTLVVSGGNGAGKSTLLKLIAGLEAPTEGEVCVSGAIGYSSPELRLYPSLSGLEHVQTAARLRGIAVDGELLGRAGLQGAADRLTSTYSTGMRARLKLALAIQAQPDTLILDEPGLGLDEQGRMFVEEIVEEQVARGPLLIATNDPLERRFATLELKLGE
jgi:heme exporter protein A